MRLLATIIAFLFMLPVAGTCEYAGPQRLGSHKGRAYLTTKVTRIYSSPSLGSSIAADQPRAHIIYAEPTSDALWLRVHELGNQIYSRNYNLPGSDTVDVKGGHFEPPSDGNDTGEYRAVDGYIEARNTTLLESIEPLLLPSAVPVPQLWAKAGIVDPRLIPLNPTMNPFGAVVKIRTIPTDDGKTAYSDCSGFLIERRDLVGTAGHCFSRYASESRSRVLIYVGLAREDGSTKWIAAQLLSWADSNVAAGQVNGVANGVGLDSALLRLQEAAEIEREPLHILSRGNWSESALIRVAVMGYGFDLDRVIGKTLQSRNQLPTSLGAELAKVFERSTSVLLRRAREIFSKIAKGRDPPPDFNERIAKTIHQAHREQQQSLEQDFRLPNLVHMSSCNLLMTDVGITSIRVNYSVLEVHLYSRNCVQGHGDSGGPLVIFNDTAQQYQVLGIISGSRGFPRKLTPAATRLLQGIIRENNLVYGGVIQAGTPPEKIQHGNYAYDTFVEQIHSSSHYLDDHFLRALQNASSISSISVLSLIDSDKTVINIDPQNSPKVTVYDEAAYIEPLRARVLIEDRDIMDTRNQLRNTLGDVVDFTQLDKEHRPYAMFVKSDAKLVYWAESDKQRLRASILQIHSPDPQSNAAKRAVQNLDDVFSNDEQFLVVGGDMFQISRLDHKILGIYRNFSRAMTSRWALDQTAQIEATPQSNTAAVDVLSSKYTGPTPASIPGGVVVSPVIAWEEIAGRRGERPLVIAAFDSGISVPGAYNLAFASAAGDFSDAVQQRLASTMSAIGATKTRPIIVYCHHDQCWLSYNAALRLIHLGYNDVRWMRDGRDGWMMKGLPVTWALPLPIPSSPIEQGVR